MDKACSPADLPLVLSGTNGEIGSPRTFIDEANAARTKCQWEIINPDPNLVIALIKLHISEDSISFEGLKTLKVFLNEVCQIGTTVSDG